MNSPLRHVVETVSTNDDVAALARDGAAEGMWLRADRQTGGRGRLGRVWISPPGNLYASTLVRPLPGDPAAPSLALVAAVALDQVTGAYAGAERIAIKWPNDLLADGAKLAGILLEGGDGAVVIGFGVNLAHHPEGIERAATSIAALTGGAPDPDSFLRDLAAAFAHWLARWRNEGLAPVLHRWLERAYPIGTALTAAGEAGLFDGLEADGTLRLRLADGSLRIVRAGDVFLL